MNVTYCIDEAASLGEFQPIRDMLAVGRGYGIRLQLYYQSLGQLMASWPDDRGQSVLSNTAQIYFSVNDVQTAEMVSKRLGSETIILSSGGHGTSVSRQGGHHPGTTYGNSHNTNWQQHSRELLKPDEVLQLPPLWAITFLPGTPPIMTQIVPYWSEPHLFRAPTRGGDFLQACMVLITSLVLCVAALGMVGMLLFGLVRG